jgi:spore germination cell wall hydrolase CwlJ-like protein
MVASLRSALLVCAAMSASSVAPAQVGPASVEIVPASNPVSTSALAQELLRKSENLAVPVVAEPKPGDSDDEASEPAPSIDRDADLPTMVAGLRSSDPGSRELECLAAGIYFESKSEPLAGQLAVGQVIANRADSGRFASTYCGVIFQRGQFSFVRGHSWPRIAKDGRQWQTAVAIAKIVDQNLKDSKVGDALFFHARRVHPGWGLKQVASIGNHIFFR